MTKLITALSLGLFAIGIAFTSAKLFAGTKYSVFCADNKIEVDMRDLDQMKSARGSNVCILKEFDYSSDADNYAQSIGGKGAACSCN
ncbi:hypothetical protein CH373_02230 [Leptospira perolatii]|uniref:Uncharacterized protein n=1 Tax=Leptospira perolatii TaxID=2023191 RepID=A0A2M9ZTA9_9LEPT|nr:hypothetical protein [Leptospira perolatii]PJZ71594.1 hypothetical protein CH360_02230 [Leptospira perolatii]PJZ75209.1 hypothetical protein CH373_02230 [Leptospira perolatii]